MDSDTRGYRPAVHFVNRKRQLASFGPELMEKSTKLQPAASAVGSLNSKVSKIGREPSGFAALPDTHRTACAVPLTLPTDVETGIANASFA